MSKKLVAVFVSIVLSAGLLPASAFAAVSDTLTAGTVKTAKTTLTVQAKSKNLKQRGVKFDLKKNKAKSTTMYVAGAGNLSYSAKLHDLKIKKTSKGKKRQATFFVTFKLLDDLTTEQIKGIKEKMYYAGNDEGTVYGGLWCHVVDYKTGQNLEYKKNSSKVKVKTKTVSQTVDTYSFSPDEENPVKLLSGLTVKVTATYPAGYKNLCVGLGGDVNTMAMMTNADYYFGNALKTKYRYHDTTWFKKARSNFHFIRIK